MNYSKNIFLVEDDKDDQEFFIQALNGIENAVLYGVANNGKEAMHRLQNTSILPSLIFMDINMPVMNGIECLLEIIKKPGIKDIPVVFLSTDTRYAEAVCKLGAKAFIKKPNDSKSLHQQLEQVINFDFNSRDHTATQVFYTNQPLKISLSVVGVRADLLSRSW